MAKAIGLFGEPGIYKVINKLLYNYDYLLLLISPPKYGLWTIADVATGRIVWRYPDDGILGTVAEVLVEPYCLCKPT